MKNYQKWFIKCCLLFCIGYCQAQISNVNHATGTLSLSVPLYTLTEGNLSVPIMATYDGSGIPVDAMPSEMGVNWQINAGGYITRTVRGMPDENYQAAGSAGIPNVTIAGYLSSSYPVETKYGFIRDFEPDLFTLFLGGQSIRFMLKTIQNQTTVVLLDDNIDVKIDAVVGPAPAQWICDGTYHLNEIIQTVSITNKLSSFVVTASDGIKYYFGISPDEREFALSTIRNDDRNNFLPKITGNRWVLFSPNKWCLSKIESPKGLGTEVYQTIKFNYSRRTSRINYLSTSPDYAPINALCAEIPKAKTNSDAFTFECQLASINCDNFDVIFNDPSVSTPINITGLILDYQANQFLNFNRKDISAPQFAFSSYYITCINPSSTPELEINPFAGFEATKALNNIIVKDKLTQKKQGFYFHHSYFSEYSLNNGTRAEYQDSRLNLSGIYSIQFNADNSTQLMAGYSFLYNGKTLAQRTSLARDHWGYYNGADENEAIGVTYNVPEASCQQAKIANLNPSLAFAQIGSLASVRLPSGGQEIFEYELHNCSNYADITGNVNVGGLRIKNIRSLEPIFGNETITNYDYFQKANPSLSSGYLHISPIYKTTKNGISYIDPSIYTTLLSRFANAGYISYENVREETIGKKNGLSQTSGYTEYDFYTKQPLAQVCEYVYTSAFTWELQCRTAISIDNSSFSTFDFVNYYDKVPLFEYLRSYPLAVRHYNSEGILQQEVKYVYSIESYSSVNTSTKTFKAGLNLPPYSINVNGGVLQSLTKPLATAGTIAGLVQLVPTPNPIVAIVGNVISIVEFAVAIINLITSSYSDSYSIYNYTVSPKKIKMDKTITRSYEPTGTNPFETTTAYFYESTKHNQVTKTTTYRSDALGANMPILSEQNIKYSADYNIPASSTDPVAKGIAGLQQRSMLVPIETLVKRKNKIVGGQFLEFYADTDKLGLLKASHSLELSQALNSFVMSDVVAGNMTKHSLYKKQQEILAYNERGLAKTTKNTTENGTTNLTFGVNNYYPTEVAYTSGAKTITKKSEYATPLFGASKITNADNSTVSYVYDDLGRIKEIKDQNGYLIKSYIYNEKAIAPPTDAIAFELWGNVGTNIKLQDLANGSTVSLATIPAPAQFPSKKVSVYITAPAGTDFVEISILNNFSTSGNRSFTDNESTIWGDVLSFNLITGNNSNATYTAEAKAYSKGLMVAKRKISFTVSP